MSSMSTHKRWYRIELPEVGVDEWDDEPCDCHLDFPHDEGQEVYA